MLAKQPLSQLSYGPNSGDCEQIVVCMVGLGRLERPTSPLSGVRSNHLSYRPKLIKTHTAERCTDHAIRNEKEKRGRRRPA